VRRANANLWPDWCPEGLWELLNRWREWCDLAGYPKSMRLPQPTFAVVNNAGVPALAAEPGYCLVPSTAPRQPLRVEEFNVAFAGLEYDQQVYIMALIELQAEEWPGGEAWTHFLGTLKLTPRQFKVLLHDALRSLLAFARARKLA